ncbi:autoinducer synthase [Sphingomonas gilva]|uniref:Acyl-homoserine-lactone synthase n=1 Tax=Sphingomonas gilva TaxID=2305907 RepID=A0A396RP33_9SPHN|nr:acyl-homoserine-lactone synthase [Sphingomonas gilva]RHW18198.1 autoinducer synthase [Sphingomonas gilva]
MIHITHGYALGDRAAATMFADRKRLFVDEMGWDVPVVADRYEIDQYDGPDATYIIARDADGDHIGSLRLLPTLGPHILGDLFPMLTGGAVPRGAAIREATRLCLPTRFDAAERTLLRNRLISAMVDHALDAGITTLTGVVSRAFRDKLMRMGWRGTPLGPPAPIGEMELAAFRIEIDAATPALLAATGIYVPATITAAAPVAVAA